MSDKEWPLLIMEGIDKSFPGVKALSRARLEVRAGSVHALMGENGAGKSTLMKCLFGVYKKDAGDIYLDGERVEFSSPGDAMRRGVAMVHQELNQATTLSVEDNIWLGRYPKVINGLPFIGRREIRRRTRELFSSLGLEIDPEVRMARLSVSERQMVEIAKAVSYGAKLIVFDEPTSSLSEKEADRLFSIIERLKASGAGIVYISHKMAEIKRICDTVTVMRDGQHIKTAPEEELSEDEIIRLMVGRDLGQRYPERRAKIGDTVLECKGLSLPSGRLKGASITLARAEVVGIAGLEGSGRTELIETIFGLHPEASGEIILRGKRIKNKNPRDAIKHGFALLTEERRATGIFGILDITENTTVSSLKKYKTGPFISDKSRKRVTREYISRLRIKTPSESARISGLSGGNQQKVILARWLLSSPDILLLDEPTRGIDVGAKYEIYSIINSLSESGKSVIVVSSEMSELLGISDRIVVMSGGRVAGEVSPKDTTGEEILTLAGKYI